MRIDQQFKSKCRVDATVFDTAVTQFAVFGIFVGTFVAFDAKQSMLC